LSRGDLSEVEWRVLQELLPPERGRRGRPPLDRRATINGILWRLRTGAPWRDVAHETGALKTDDLARVTVDSSP